MNNYKAFHLVLRFKRPLQHIRRFFKKLIYPYYGEAWLEENNRYGLSETSDDLKTLNSDFIKYNSNIAADFYKLMQAQSSFEVDEENNQPKAIESSVGFIPFNLKSTVKNGEIKEVGDKRFVRMADKFINIDDLHIDLIDQVNPFQKAFEVLSKSITKSLLKVVSETIEAQKIIMTDEEAVVQYKKIKVFMEKQGREPKLNSNDPLERRMAEAVVYLKNKQRQKN